MNPVRGAPEPDAPETSGDDMDALWYILPVAGLCSALACFLLHRSGGSARLSSVVRDLLTQAAGQGSMMLVEFSDRDASARPFLGPCAEFGREHIVITVPGAGDLSEWLGKAVTVSFKISGGGAVSYYQFESLIRRCARGNGGCRLFLATPKDIVSAQRRKYVRIPLAEGTLMGLSVWQLGADCPQPRDAASLGKEHLRCQRNELEQLALLNLSAAGLRLQVHLGTEPPPLDAQLGERLICRLQLRSAKDDQHLPLWLDCTIVNRQEEHAASVSFGLNFRAWAMSDQDNRTVKWRPVGQDGWVGPLDTWVRQQQLAQLAHRKARLEPEAGYAR